MEIYTVSLFGHRQIDDPFTVEHELEKIVRELLAEKEYVEFLVGRDGEFDLLAASVIKRCRRAVGEENSALIWMLPYLTAEYRDHEEDYLNYYDDVEVSQNAAGAHPKGAMQIRNREMVDRSDLVIFFVEHAKGGAYQTMRYAEKQGTAYINISENGRKQK
ncbi:MAG: hypothetical protein IJX67_08470 [Oscillospiraceae bacterium]|nr:hypothetical protein [Oscillospiraceae bacterium]